METVSSSHVRLDRLLSHAVGTYGQRVAVHDESVSLTYEALDARADAVCARLARQGISPNDPVVVVTKNRPQDLAAFLGVWRSGGVPVPVHAKAAEATVRDIAAVCGAASIVKEPGDAIDLPPARGATTRLDLDDAAFVVFTSGTTGRPKGVVQRHATYCGKLAEIDRLVPFAPGTTTLLALQLTFAFGQWASLLTLARGGTVRLLSRFDARDVVAALAAGDIARFPVVPSMLRLIAASNPEPAAACTTVFMAGGEPLAAAVGEKILRLFPNAAMSDIYGLTETNSADFIVLPDRYRDLAGTIGYPTGGVAYRIVDGGQVPVAPGQVGELQIDSAYVMAGYLGDDATTRAAFAGRYLKTGDLAVQRPDGAVALVGRVKDIIGRGGYKVSPIEVENVYAGHRAIAGALAVGLPHETLGETIHLAVVLAPGESLTDQELHDWGMRRLERYKVPEWFHVVEALPSGATGKADRRALQRMLVEQQP